MTDAEPRCPKCHETGPLVERVSRPIWASAGAELYFCNVCAHTFLHWTNKPTPSV